MKLSTQILPVLPSSSRRVVVAPGRPVSGAASSGLSWADVALATAFLVTMAVVYGALGLRLAEGRYFEYFNLAFDFDQSRVLNLLTGDPADPMGFKHPLMLYLRPLGLALLGLGVAAKPATALIMAMTGAATVALVLVFLRCTGIGRPEAAALAALFAVTGTPIVTAITPESYGFAGLTVVLSWVIAQRRLENPARLGIARYLGAVATAGITITNVIQPLVAEVAVHLRHHGSRGLLKQVLRFGLIVAALFTLAALVLWWRPLLEALAHPVEALKSVWWLQTQDERTGPLAVLKTFLVLSFVSPNASVVPLPEGIRMIDFRELSFTPAASVAAVLWLVFLVLGTVAGLLHPGYRMVALPILVALLLNIAFHLRFQSRGSLYIYAAHVHFLVFALAAGMAPWAAALARARWLYVAGVLGLTLLTGATNLTMASGFVERFDKPDADCEAPCATFRETWRW